MSLPLLSAGHYFVFVRELRLSVSIGIHDFERASPQTIVVDVFLALRRQGQPSDDIATVIDYDFVREAAFAIAKDRHIDLQETLCQELINACRQNGAEGVIVRSEKRGIYKDTIAAGCEMAWFDKGVLR